MDVSTLAILAAFQKTAFPPPKPVVVVQSAPAPTPAPVPIKPTAPPKAVFVAPKTTGDVLDRIAKCESGMRNITNSTSKYRGYFQFDLATYHSNGGTGDPLDYSYAEQKRVAQNLYNRRGGAPWPTCSKR